MNKTYIDFENTGMGGMTSEQWRWHNLLADRNAIDEVLNGEKPF